MKHILSKITRAAATAALLLGQLVVGVVAQASTTGFTQVAQDKLAKEVRHELVMLPFYSIFDDFGYKVDMQGNVALYGQVTRPTLKSDAERAASRIEGVRSVTNNIEVLPLSPFDNEIRFAVARSIYGYGSLQRYGLGANPSIHIIVKNGHVSLEGVVANEGDKDIAGIRANGVFGVFSVQNDLRVEGKS